jgi:hypothetical protein
MQLAGSPAGIAYAGGIADNAANGYALGLRPFQIVEGWLSGPIQVSREFGKRPGTSLSGCLSPAPWFAWRLAGRPVWLQVMLDSF